MRKTRQSGFSLLELLVAMMIIAVIATLGFTKYREFSDQARYIKAKDTLQIVSSGLDQYYLKHGQFPSMTTFESLIDANSPLVKENMIPPNVPAKDPWGNPFEATSGKGVYALKCQGDPSGNEDRKAFTLEPGRMGENSNSQTPGAPAPKAAP